jgi:nicotinamidase/pyrazinamidase
MKALFLMDLQNDFGSFGVLEVKETAKILAIANQLIHSGYFDCIIATQYAHPADHKSFAANHFFRYPNQIVAIEGVEQRLWSIHCVEGSFGADFMNGLELANVDKIIHRAIDTTRPSYSCFDNNNIVETELTQYLKTQKVEEVFFLGVNTEYAIKDSALDAQKLGFKTFLLEDACLAANLDTETDGQTALQELQKAGILLLDSDQLIL